MKHFLKCSTLLFCLFCLLTQMSCKKDGALDREKFLGAYSVLEDCSPGQTFNMSVTESSSGESGVVISNFGNFSNNVTGTVSGSSITIASQTFNFNNNGTLIAVTLTGGGSIIDKTMTITYSWTAAAVGTGGTCAMTCSKQ